MLPKKECCNNFNLISILTCWVICFVMVHRFTEFYCRDMHSSNVSLVWFNFGCILATDNSHSMNVKWESPRKRRRGRERVHWLNPNSELIVSNSSIIKIIYFFVCLDRAVACVCVHTFFSRSILIIVRMGRRDKKNCERWNKKTFGRKKVETKVIKKKKSINWPQIIDVCIFCVDSQLICCHTVHNIIGVNVVCMQFRYWGLSFSVSSFRPISELQEWAHGCVAKTSWEIGLSFERIVVTSL